MSRKKAALEPIGHLTFGAADAMPLVTQSAIEDWYRQARIEFALSRSILPILNSTDKEIEESVTSAPDPAAALDRLMTLAELCIEFRKKHEDGVKVMEAACSRALVVCERISGDAA